MAGWYWPAVSFCPLGHSISLLWWDALWWALTCDIKTFSLCAPPKCQSICLNPSPPCVWESTPFPPRPWPPSHATALSPGISIQSHLGLFLLLCQKYHLHPALWETFFPSPLSFKAALECGSNGTPRHFQLIPTNRANLPINQAQVVPPSSGYMVCLPIRPQVWAGEGVQMVTWGPGIAAHAAYLNSLVLLRLNFGWTASILTRAQ